VHSGSTVPGIYTKVIINLPVLVCKLSGKVNRVMITTV
jgi:hypothetical protein